MTLINDVITRFGTGTLVHLTNYAEDEDATTINEDRLQAAIDDAAGDFAAKTGILYNNDSAEFKAILMNGIIYKLQYYKDLDSSLTETLGRNFYGALSALARRKSIGFRTRSDADINRNTYKQCEHPLSRNNSIFNIRGL